MLGIQDVLIFVATAFILFRWKVRELYNLAAKIPGYSDLQMIPIFRKLYADGPECFYQALIDVGKPFKSAFKFRIGQKLFVMLRDPDDVKIILNHKDCTHKNENYIKFFDNGLVFSSGDEHKTRKKNAIPVFYQAAVKKFIPVVDTKMKSFLRRFEAKHHQNEFDIVHSVLTFTLDVVLSTICGTRIDNEAICLRFIEDVSE